MLVSQNQIEKPKVKFQDIIDNKNNPDYNEAIALESLIDGGAKAENASSETQEEIQETNVSKKLSDFTTKRVVIVVLLIMISLPIFSFDTYY